MGTHALFYSDVIEEIEKKTKHEIPEELLN